MGIRFFGIFWIYKYSIYFVLCLYWIHYIVIYTFLVIYFAWYKEYMIFWISFTKFSYVLSALTCASAIDNLWNFCLSINISKLIPSVGGNGNVPFLKPLTTISLPS